MQPSSKVMKLRAPVLDHGYVQFVDSWGGDESVIEAARMSTQKGFQGWGPIATRVPSKLPSGGETIEERPGDEKLLRYLYEHAHHTPFEMAGMVIEVQAPIFVFREWHRHRTQSYNEMSARYAPLPDLNYIPTVSRVMRGGGHLTKQAGAHGGTVLTEAVAHEFVRDLSVQYASAQTAYEDGLANGVPKELARLVLPVGRYSRMRASANLRNWLGFLTLRMDENAQWEIRDYANAVGQMIADLFPRTWELFNEKRTA